MDAKCISGPFQHCQDSVSPWGQQGSMKHSSAASGRHGESFQALLSVPWELGNPTESLKMTCRVSGADPDLCHQVMPTAMLTTVDSWHPLFSKTQFPTTLLGLSCLFLTGEHDFIQLWRHFTPEQFQMCRISKSQVSSFTNVCTQISASLHIPEWINFDRGRIKSQT